MKEFITDTVANTIKSLSKKTLLITILLSLISSLSTYWLVKAMEGFKTEIQASGDEIKELRIQVQVIALHYQTNRQHWMEADKLQKKQIAKSDSQLVVARQRQSAWQKKIVASLSDTSECKQACDSAKEEVQSYISATQESDSLCDNEIAELKTVITTKDSALDDCNESFLLMQQAADSSLKTATSLQEQLKLADKELRKGNIKSKFLSSAVMVLSGATAILLLRK